MLKYGGAPARSEEPVASSKSVEVMAETRLPKVQPAYMPSNLPSSLPANSGYMPSNSGYNPG